MRAAVYAAAFAVLLAFTGMARAAEKAEKAEKGGKVTLSGEMTCAKCGLKEADKCQNVLKVTDGGAETKYYLVQNPVAKDNHKKVCGGNAKATVTGSVKEEGGKKMLTASEIKYE